MAIQTVNNGIFNNYVKRPKNLTQYTAFRGVTDFSQIGQFNQFERGYAFLSVIKMPTFIEKLGEQDATLQKIIESFRHALEYEFRGLSGLPDMTGDPLTITDGINDQNVIAKVTSDTSIEISMPYFEKSGGLFTKFTEYYLTGIHDKNSQAKTYHGLIANGILDPGYENEVFTFLYYVTDSTMLELERAYLLANAQLTTATSSMYDANRSDIGSNQELDLRFNCFPISGYEVDKAAKALLQGVTGVNVRVVDSAGTVQRSVVATEGVAVLDTNAYLYGIMDENSADKIDTLVDAVNTDTNSMTV